MKLRHRVVEFSGSETYDALRAELDRLGARYRISHMGTVNGVHHWSLEWILFETDPLYPSLGVSTPEPRFTGAGSS